MRRRRSYYYPRRRSTRRRSRGLLSTRAPRKGTLIIAVIIYTIGILGAVGLMEIPPLYVTIALATAGGLLILGTVLRDL